MGQINWTAKSALAPCVIEGAYVRLEPLDVGAHCEGLMAASVVDDGDAKFRWLPEFPPEDMSDFRDWTARCAQSVDPQYSAVIDVASGRVAGRQTLMRNDMVNGVIEIGNIYWGPLMARQRGATEALYLHMKYVFEDLGYRRFEWKCNDQNMPSKRAALRFGFQAEGVFRQHMIVKGENRDTAWFAMTDGDWPRLKQVYEAWLATENFDENGAQKQRLEEV